MTPEEKALERFVKEKQRGGKKSAIFDLEDDEDGDEFGELTHLGKPLGASNGDIRDDYQGSASEDNTDLEGEKRGKKRRRLSEDEPEDSGSVIEAKADWPKTKKEIMKEVIAKSKLHKYERQKAQEDDDDLRAELDEGLGDLYAMLRGRQPAPKPQEPFEPSMNPDRAALLSGKARDEADREYDARMRQMAFDARSKPSARTKTEEEKVEEEATRLRELEEQRMRRMRGEDVESDQGLQGDGDDDFFDEAVPALGSGPPANSSVHHELDVEDEDEFVLDDDLLASGSELDLAESGEPSSEESEVSTDEEEHEFVADLPKETVVNDESKAQSETAIKAINGSKSLAFTYSCPKSVEEFLQITENIPFEEVPTAIQRIRALHHPNLSNDNKDKLRVFSQVLVGFTAHVVDHKPRPPFAVVEQLIRHTHSLAKSFPEEVSEAFRDQLKTIHKERPTALRAGDLITLVAIGTIFPTSDHWHQVTTPAMLTMARYLEHAVPSTVADLARGAYLGTLCLQYQSISKRYIPELVNYILNAIHMLSPQPPQEPFGLYPDHGSPEALRIGSFRKKASDPERPSNFWDISIDPASPEIEDVKMSLLRTNIALISEMTELWADKSAYYEIMRPFWAALGHLKSRACRDKIPPTLLVSSSLSY